MTSSQLHYSHSPRFFSHKYATALLLPQSMKNVLNSFRYQCDFFNILSDVAGSRSDCVNWKIVIDALSRHRERRQIAENVKSFNEFRIWFDSFRNLILLWSIEDDSDELMQTLYWWAINSSPNFDADEAIYCPHPQFCWFALHKK